MSFLTSQDFFFTIISYSEGQTQTFASWQRGFWSTYTVVWNSSRIGFWTSNFLLLHGGPTGSSNVLWDQIPSVCRRQPSSRQGNPSGLGCMSPQDRELCRIKSIHEWRSSCRLELNSDRAELIWFGTRSMLPKLQGLETGIRVSGVEVKQSNQVRDLGVKLDCQLNLRAHIGMIVSACYYHLLKIRHRHCLDKVDRQRLVSARVLSRTDYSNVALIGLPEISLAPLQRVINAAARYVANLQPRDHVLPCSVWSKLAPNPWANIIQGVPHDVQCRQ